MTRTYETFADYFARTGGRLGPREAYYRLADTCGGAGVNVLLLRADGTPAPERSLSAKERDAILWSPDWTARVLVPVGC